MGDPPAWRGVRRAARVGDPPAWRGARWEARVGYPPAWRGTRWEAREGDLTLRRARPVIEMIEMTEMIEMIEMIDSHSGLPTGHHPKLVRFPTLASPSGKL